MTSSPPTSSLKTLRRVAIQARPYWPYIGLLLLCSLLTTPLSLLNPVPLKLVIDSVLGDHELPAVLQALVPEGTARSAPVVVALVAGILVAIALVRHSAEMGNSVFRAWIAEKLVLQFRSKLFRHVQSLSLSFHDTKGAADTAYRIQYDAPAVRWIMADAVAPLATSSIMLVAMVIILLRIDWQIALVALTIVPALFLASSVYSKRLKRH